MKPLLVNTYQNGGAGNACSRLHAALLGENIDAQLLVKKGAGHRVAVMPQNDHTGMYEKLRYKIDFFLKELKLKPRKKKLQIEYEVFADNRVKEGLEHFSLPNSNIDITRASCYQSADIINLHWVSGFVDHGSFFQENRKPLVWTLHDMNPFLYGNHYLEPYFGISTDGYPIKRVVTAQEQKFASLIKKEKQRMFRSGGSDIFFVCLCKWMQRELAKSDLFSKNPTTIIENSVDTSIFQNRNKEFARELLGLPADKLLFLFVSESLSNNRKGLPFLVKAMERFHADDALFCSVGCGSIMDPSILSLGSITDERMMSVVYSAADAFIIPSIEDNTPNTILESLCCGTPVIGFPVGGIPELVDSDSGILAQEVSVEALACALTAFMENPRQFDSLRIQEKAHIRFAMKRQALQYVELYQRLLTR